MESILSRSPTDADLHQRLVYGDESALAEAYGAFGGLVLRVAWQVTRSTADAQDVTQEVFAQLWSRPYTFDPYRGTLRTWLSMLAHGLAVRRAHGDGGAAEESLRLHAELAGLPLPQRQVVHLAHFAGRTYRQVAVELGVPEDTVRTRLRSALGRLAATRADPPGPAAGGEA